MLSSTSFREPLPFRGGALLSESAISWLATKPQVLDVPEKAAIGAGMKLSEESRGSIRRYVVLFMPLSPVLFGIAVLMRRRGTERRGHPRHREEGQP